jgi:hypothetical protein
METRRLYWDAKDATVPSVCAGGVGCVLLCTEVVFVSRKLNIFEVSWRRRGLKARSGCYSKMSLHLGIGIAK